MLSMAFCCAPKEILMPRAMVSTMILCYARKTPLYNYQTTPSHNAIPFNAVLVSISRLVMRVNHPLFFISTLLQVPLCNKPSLEGYGPHVRKHSVEVRLLEIVTAFCCEDMCLRTYCSRAVLLGQSERELRAQRCRVVPQ